MAGINYGFDNKDFCTPQVQSYSNVNAYTGVIIPGARWAEWVDRTYDYLNARAVYTCPTQVANGASQTSANGITYAMSTYVHQWAGTSGANASTGKLLKTSAFRRQSNAIYYVDSGYYTAWGTAVRPQEKFSPYLSWHGINLGTTFSNANRVTPSTRHRSPVGRVDLPGQGPSEPSGFNAGFFDGHAQFMEWNKSFPMRADASGSVAMRLIRDTYWLP